MSKINIRSPYFINVYTTDITRAILDIYIYTGSRVVTMDSITYSLDSEAYNGVVSFEISQLISDYLDISFNGVYDSQVVWVNYQLTEYILDIEQTPNSVVQTVAFDGYGYFEDGVNPQLTDKLLQSNDTLYVYDNNYFYIPIQQDKLTKVDLKSNGVIIDTQNFTPTIDSADVIRYIGYTNPTQCSVATINYLFENADNYLFEDGNNFIFNTSDFIDEIFITYSDATTKSVTVKTIFEPKYTPYSITFVNKYGALQSVWMMKRSDISINIESETYRGYLYNNYNYDISQHQYRNFNVTGKQTLSLNSGFYPESFNAIFKELLLSEKIWVYYEQKLLPVTIKSKELAFKTQVSDKLIDYKIDFEFAFDTINSVY